MPLRRCAAFVIGLAAMAILSLQQGRSQPPDESIASASPRGTPPAPLEAVDREVSETTAVSPLVVAYASAMGAKLDEYLEWTRRNDEQSADQLVGELIILVDAAGALGDAPPWREATSQLRQAVEDLRSDGASDVSEVRERIAQMAEAVPGGTPQSPPRPGRMLVGLMHTLDGLMHNASRLTDEENLVDARRHMAVLSDMGRMLAPARRDEDWRPRAEAVIQAADQASQSTTSDLDEFRRLLRMVRIRCDECHEASR